MTEEKIRIDDEARVLKVGFALCHPMRIALLLAHANGGAASATILSRAGLGSLNNVAYHQRQLVALGALELVHSHQGRGAIEHHYELSDFGQGIVKLAEVVGRN